MLARCGLRFPRGADLSLRRSSRYPVRFLGTRGNLATNGAVLHWRRGLSPGSAALIAVGAIQDLYRVFTAPFGARATPRAKKDMWLHFGTWLLLGLGFELGADVVKTAIAPTEGGRLIQATVRRS